MDEDGSDGDDASGRSVADDDRLSTGLPALDRALGGGLRPGSLVAVVGGPDAPTEPVVHATAAPRPTRYLTTLRPPDQVRESLERRDVTATVGWVSGDELVADPSHLEGLDAGSTVVVDPITDAEQGGREEYSGLLAAAKRALRASGSVGVLHCFETTPPTLRRDLTLARADLVWRVGLVAEDAVGVRLTVTKARDHAFPDRRFDLDVTGAGVTATPVES